MALLRNFERSLSGLVEGTVGRVFRTEVRPTEIARKLAREMELGKRVSLSRTYGPTDYLVYLSADDRRRYASMEEAIADELSAYLLEHARRERLVLVRRPKVVFETDARLRLGEFGIEVRATPITADEGRTPEPAGAFGPPAAAAPAPPPPASAPVAEPQITPDLDAPYDDPFAHDPFGGDLDEHSWEDAPAHPEPSLAADDGWLDPVDPWDVADPSAPAAPPPAPVPPAVPVPAARPAETPLVLVVDGERRVMDGDVVVIGRSRTSDVVVSDPSVSRRHAELRREPDGWYVSDLGSTNGTTLDGTQLSQPLRVTPGQQLVVGHAETAIEVR